MTHYIKTIRDTQTGKIYVNPPAKAPGELQPYRLKYQRYCAECVQVYDSELKAAKAYADELLYMAYNNMAKSEKLTELKKLSKKLSKMKVTHAQLQFFTGMTVASHRAYLSGIREPNARYLARLRLLTDGLQSFMEEYEKRLPESGDCGNSSMSRGGNPDIQKYANR